MYAIRSYYEALLSAEAPTPVETETENRSPKDFPTVTRGPKDLSVDEKAGSTENLSSPAIPRIPSSTLPVYGLSAMDAASAAETDPSAPPSSSALTPCERRLKMSFLLNGGSDTNSTFV